MEFCNTPKSLSWAIRGARIAPEMGTPILEMCVVCTPTGFAIIYCVGSYRLHPEGTY